jgi:hypothetical protein
MQQATSGGFQEDGEPSPYADGSAVAGFNTGCHLGVNKMWRRGSANAAPNAIRARIFDI